MWCDRTDLTEFEMCIRDRDGADPEIVRDPERRQRPRLGKASLRAERGGAVGTNAG